MPDPSENAVLTSFTYLAIVGFSLLGPLVFSFLPQSKFANHGWRIVLTILTVAIPFLVWDVAFTAQGIWGFNPTYYMGFTIKGLPLEEIMFFFFIPFSCLFIYDTVKKYSRWNWPIKPIRWICLFLGLISLDIAVTHGDKAYTVSSFGAAGILLLLLAAGVLRQKLGYATVAFLFHSIPFFIVNGILTALPVVWYNDNENLARRLGSIPIEDTAYSLVLIISNIIIFEWLLKRFPLANKT